MRIAVNTRFLLAGKLEGIGWFTYEIIRRMVLSHPEHEFIFFFDRPYDEQFVFASNVTPVVLHPPARHPLLWMIWYEVSVRRALKKHRADLFISTDGFLSLGTKVPTLLVIHDLAFEHYPEHLPFKFRSYLRYFTPRFAARANHIVTVSDYSRDDLVKTYGISPEKISVVYNGANEQYQPMSFEEKQTVRDQYAQGAQYFVFAGALHPRKNVERLLQAFAYFKKKQHSGMKLLIIGRFAWNADEIKRLLAEHPFREDVIHLDYMQVDTLSKVIGAAYGLMFVSLYEGFGIPVLEALKCDVPGIISNCTSLPEVGGEACLYANPEDVADIGEQMRLFYKDEYLRSTLVAKCAAQAAKFNWQKSAEDFYRVVEREFMKGKS
ncbi:MAG: glycosyltransferase family 4 protein [Chitinophagaceae bacterium]|nr:glycosyltransferase family 4 protein [Chitinophagaceae bacterium]